MADLKITRMVSEFLSPLQPVNEYLQPPGAIMSGLESHSGLEIKFLDVSAHCSNGFRVKEHCHQLLPQIIVVKLCLLDFDSCQGLQENRNPSGYAFDRPSLVIANLSAHCGPNHCPPLLHFQLLRFISICCPEL